MRATVPLDESLPQLSEITSEAVMGALFGAYMDPGWRLNQLTVDQVQYEPHESCVLSYRLRCQRPSGRKFQLKLYGRAFAPGSAQDSFRCRPPLATTIGRLPSFLPQAHLALWRFPDDPGLLGVADVWRRGAAIFDSSAVLDETLWKGRRPRMETSLLRYDPSRTCVLRYEMMHESQMAATFHGCVYGVADAPELHGQMRALWEWSRTRAPELTLSRPLGCDEKLNTVWYAPPAGEPFWSRSGRIDLVAGVRRIAAALASLHRSEVQPRRHGTVANEKSGLQSARRALLRFFPELERDLSAFLNALIDDAPGETEDPRPIHGDFHCDQVLLHEDRVALQNLDQYSLGDPLLDVSRFLAELRAASGKRMTPELAREVERAFLSTYCMLAPINFDARRLDWFVATQMINRELLKPVRRLSRDGSQEVLALLRSAARDSER